ncbi:PD-(D/E)XK nuclease family protein [Pelomonas sp. CA6]|uniref:PD-(D/E)XK nuclease family protein n=1 Tax=Pelomonas sp. CA6 TaxID=2907999 RepID=UPI001F4C1E91|nr:PD-(D/E)XK nuclease family protein [Pelomonas sp. CA6]MCH7344122.1 PD-(D/E)XK nuclease family protein [Pelomonas sp. CA6]
MPDPSLLSLFDPPPGDPLPDEAMPAFDHVFALDERHGAQAFWTRLAEHVEGWLSTRGLAARDVIVLLPFAQHLAPARRAWMALAAQRRARAGAAPGMGWQPRFETTHSLAAALGPSPLPQPHEISGDAAIDLLAARELLQGQSWAQQLQRADAQAYQMALQQLVELAQQLQRAAELQAPARRPTFWDRAREQLSAPTATGQLERALALVALEWAIASDREPATDRLFELRPAAWVHLQCGGPDRLADALLQEARAIGLPCLRLSAELVLEPLAPLGEARPPLQVEVAVCEDFEDVAQCSAAAVLAHLRAGRAPVALIAQDRVVLRRVRALLERQQVGLSDETGWTLATTPVAAQLMALLRASRREASLDEWLAWLKTPLAAALRARCGQAALGLLESRCRSEGWSKPQQLREDRLAPSAARLWALAREGLAALQGGARRSLQDWLALLTELLQGLGADAALEAQDAGPQLLDALWLRRSPWPGSAHEAVLQQAQLSHAEFLAWVGSSLEAAQVVPPLQGELQVMVTPLARAMLRPFGAIVLPGAEVDTLGPVPPGPALLNEAQCRALGLPTQDDKREALTLQFAQLLRTPWVTLLRRAHAGSEPLPPSPLLERLGLALQQARWPVLRDWADPREQKALARLPQPRAQALAAGRLPRALSASGVDSLRQCPYQFFARVLLGLRENQELEAAPDKRDYGTWLHAVLQQFHEERLAGDPPGLGDEERLLLAAQAQQRRLGLAAEEFLPFSASLARFVPRYLAWLAETEAAGQCYAAGELAREVHPWREPPLTGLALLGRLDRVDVAPGARVLLDYKTGSLQSLKDKVADPLEDTQLAVYAALMQGAELPAGPPALQAAYLALDESRELAAVAHPEVEHSAALMLQGLGEDLGALHGGQPLPALGEGPVCDYCEMRGLCRRDDWAGEAL